MSEIGTLDDRLWRIALIERTIEDALLMIETRGAVQSGQFCSVAATLQTMVTDALPALFEAQAALLFALKLLNARAIFMKGGTQKPKEKARAEELEQWTVDLAKTLKNDAGETQNRYLEILTELVRSQKAAAAAGQVMQ